jgi:hypothetical protein
MDESGSITPLAILRIGELSRWRRPMTVYDFQAMRRAKRGARNITAEEEQRLLREGPRVFQERGVVNHERGVFARLVGDEVVGRPHPLFWSMQPKIKVRQTPAWLRAYSIVFAFLRDQHADETQLAIDMEFAKSGQQPQVSKPQPDDGSDDDFDQLLQSVPIEDDSFARHVRSYTGKLYARPMDDSSKGAFLTQPSQPARPRAFPTEAWRSRKPPASLVAKPPPPPASQSSSDALDISLEKDGDEAPPKSPPRAVVPAPPKQAALWDSDGSDLGSFSMDSDREAPAAPPTGWRPSSDPNNDNGQPKLDPGQKEPVEQDSFDFDEILDIGSDF